MIANEGYGSSTLPTSTFSERSTSRTSKKCSFQWPWSIFFRMLPQTMCYLQTHVWDQFPPLISQPPPRIRRDTNHLSHMHASDEDQMRDATQRPQLVLGPKLLATWSCWSLHSLAGLATIGSWFRCWSLRNSCNWYQYYKYSEVILSYCHSSWEQILPCRFWTSLSGFVNDGAPESLSSIMKYWISHKPHRPVKNAHVVSTFDLETFLL